MKKFTIILIGIGLVFIGVGVIMTSGDYNKLFKSFYSYDSSKYTKELKTITSQNLKSILVDAKNEKITIKSTNKEEITITYYESEYTKYDFKDSSNTVSLILVEDKLHFFNIGLNFFTPDIVIEIPEYLVLEYNIKISNAKIVVENLQINNSTFKTNNARIELTNVTSTERIQLKTDNGLISVKNCNFATVNADTANARIYLEGTVLKAFTGKTNNGEIILSDSDVTDNLNLKTTNGKVSFTGVSAPYIDVRTSNGKIVGSVFGDANEYYKDFKTTNGRIWLNGEKYSTNINDYEKKEKNIFLQTTNGSIRIDFR